MSALDAIAGNGQTVEALKTALAGGSLSHAVLLAGPDGCGRNFAARCLAADYLYPAGGPGAEATLRGEGPEVLQVAGEGKSGNIPVERIRQVRSDMFLSALSAAGRCLIIRDAQRMAAPAANALLKILEEPPADVLFILTATGPGALPTTIVSRCAVYTLGPVEADDCRRLLAECLPPGADPGLPALLCALYDGRAGLGQKALESEERLATLRDALAAAKAAAARDSYGLLRIFSAYEGRGEDERRRRDDFLADFTDTLAACLRRTAVPGLPQMPPGAAALLLGPVQSARAALAGNGLPKITFTALAVELVRAGLTA